MNILVVDDDERLAGYVADGVRDRGHEVAVAHDGYAALDALRHKHFDAVVLDRMLPGLDGIGVLRTMREERMAAPVLMLTALGALDDRIVGLEAGADDYLTKPFARAELAARLDAIVRRSRRQDEPKLLTLGDLELDLLRHTVRRGERVIAMQRREFGLLSELVANRDQVVTRAMLLERVWGYNFDPSTNIVDSHVSRLRAKLTAGGEPDPVVTVRGTGYMIRAT